jgi:hypothetical protein
MSANSAPIHPHTHTPHTLEQHGLARLIPLTIMLHFTLYSTRNKNDTVLFALAVFAAALQLGLTAYLLTAGNHMRGASYNTLFVAFHSFYL